MPVVQAAENHGDEWGLTWYLSWGIYSSVPTWTWSPNLLAAAEALSLNISSYATSLKWPQRPSQSNANGHKLCNEMRHPVLSLTKSQW